jgi:hypothetical protein
MEDKSKIASEKQKSISYEYRAGGKGQDDIDPSSTAVEIRDELQGNLAEE